MKSEAFITLTSIGTVLGVLYAAHRIVGALHGLIGPHAGVTETDIYIFILIGFSTWYTKTMTSNVEQKLEQKLNDMHQAINKEWHDAMDLQMEKLTLSVMSTESKMEEFKKEVKNDIDEIKGGINQLVAHALNEKL
jgi:hypothetical protein